MKPFVLTCRAPTPSALADGINTFVIRTHGPKRVCLTYLLTTLKLTGIKTVHLSDQRDGTETEFRTDKSVGGWLHKRRKHRRHAQEAWQHLVDMAHTYLAWFAFTELRATLFADFGPLRITRDLYRTPGLVEFRDGQLFSVKLLQPVPQAGHLLTVLGRFWE